MLGKRFWDQQAGFRLRLGPLRYAQFLELLPDGGSLPGARADGPLLRGQEFDFDVQLVLKADEFPCADWVTGGPALPASAGPPGSGAARAPATPTTPCWAADGLVAPYPIVNP